MIASVQTNVVRQAMQWLGRLGLIASAAVLLSACERPPMKAQQAGYRGTGMEQISNPRIDAANASKHLAPDSPPPASVDGPKARDVYQIGRASCRERV